MESFDFKTSLEKFEGQLWGHHIPVPDDIYQHFKDSDRRVICQLNDLPPFQCALMPAGNGSFFINVNKELRKKLQLNVGEKISANIKKDNSKYGLPMPEEMEELMFLDDEGAEYFHQLTPGKQRSLLHLIGKPKSSEIRLKKAVVVLDYLKLVKGKLDFKELNQAFKDANRKG